MNGEMDKRTVSEAFPSSENAPKRPRLESHASNPMLGAAAAIAGSAPIRPARSFSNLPQQQQQQQQLLGGSYPTSFQPASSLPINTLDLLDRKALQQKLLLQQQQRQQQQQISNNIAARMGSDGGSFGNMLESLHGVQPRQAPMPKRTINGYNGSAAHFLPPDTDRSGTPKGLSTLMHGVSSNRPEAFLHRTPSGLRAGKSSVVDLTNDDEVVEHLVEDDDVIYNGTVVRAEREVCYGMIKKASASIHRVPDTPKGAQLPGNGAWWPLIPVLIRRGPPGSIVVDLIDPSGNHFGNLTRQAASAISSLLDLEIARPKGFITPRVKRSEVVGNPTSQIIDMAFTIYGTESSARKVGNLLGHYNFFFIDPTHGTLERGYEYKNPHYASVDDGSGGIGSSRMSTNFSIRTTEEIKNEITGVLDSLELTHNLPEMEPDAKIITPMLPHQKQGLYFMSQKEGNESCEEMDGGFSSPLWKVKQYTNGQKKYTNVITGEELRTEPPISRGGILADEMGLGKTLTVLSLILSSMDEANEYAEQEKVAELDREAAEADPSVMYAKTTLLICPLSVLSNWEEQIKSHLQPDSLSFYVYHGNNRTTNYKDLAKYDVIVTTYALVANDYSKNLKKGRSVLQKLNYFRIVLDEAHIIREASTAQSRGVCKLEASRRWAVTGTPVQNRLDDLGTLIKFLRVTPFDTKAQFSRFISGPLKSGDPTSMDKLRALVDSIALRRRKDKIDLPPKHDNTVHLDFSKDEKELYDATARQSRYKMDMVFRKGHLGGQAYVNVLQMILRLRMICASRDLLGVEDTAGLVSSNAIDLDAINPEDSLAMDKKQAFEIFDLMRESDEASCYICNKEVVPPGPRDGSPGGGSSGDEGKDLDKIAYGHLSPCPHLFCSDCGPKYLNGLKKDHKLGEWVTCPLCNHGFRLGLRDLKPCDDPANKKDEKVKKKVMYVNPSTKIKALVEQLLRNRDEGDEENGRVKSVVFSGWTTHLDLIEVAFAHEGITWRRLDGKMSRGQRAEAMRSFREEDDVEVILVSIMAGGVGLNLTAANKVYVMEPQFNPAAEAQAIDRVHRLGQKRDVTCIRFIMRNSFEEKIVLLQRKKQRIADLSMSQGKTKAQKSQEKIDVSNFSPAPVQ